MWSFIALSIFATSATASVFTIPLIKHSRTGEYLKGVVAADLERAAALITRSYSGPTTVPAINLEYVQYTTRVGIGYPPTYYHLIVDTGSSNTFCGAGLPYVQTNTSLFTGEYVNVTYESGAILGLEFLDQVTLAPNLVIANQSIGDALHDVGFSNVDGILGVGPRGLTKGTLTPGRNETIPTIMDNLVSQGIIEDNLLGVYFAPSGNHSNASTNGALTYGGIDSCLYEGEVTFLPLTDTYPASKYWGINMTLLTYGNHTIIHTSTVGIVDTGTTMIILADNLFSEYMKLITGARLDSTTGLIEIPPCSVPDMKPLTFLMGGRNFTMDVAAQLIPTNENTALGGVPGKQYGTVTGMRSISGHGFDFILGQKFMERYYTVFDADNHFVGFAETNHTFTTFEG